MLLLTFVADLKKKNVFLPFVLPQNIFPMDLRSTNKVPEKPPPRLRLSLTRSMSTDVDGRTIRSRQRRQVPKRVLEGQSNRRVGALRKKVEEEPTEEDWSSNSEEEKQELESATEERREDSVYGEILNQFVLFVLLKVDRSKVKNKLTLYIEMNELQ